LRRGQNGELKCLFTANAAADIFYLYSRARDVKTARAALDFLLTRYSAVSVTHEDCVRALSLAIEDFEDALAVVCAQKANADCIVTRDEKLIKADSPVRIIPPGELAG
jgi:predicted nucleic acid-binding protein